MKAEQSVYQRLLLPINDRLIDQIINHTCLDHMGDRIYKGKISTTLELDGIKCRVRVSTTSDKTLTSQRIKGVDIIEINNKELGINYLIKHNFIDDWGRDEYHYEWAIL